MSDPDETRTITGWRTASRFYRRTPGLGWLLALLAIPLLLGLLGWGVLDKSKKDVDLSLPSVSPTVSVPSVTAPNITAPNINLPSLGAALGILRNGNDITLTGDLPDLSAKTGLLDILKGAFGPNINLIDKLNIKAGITAPDFSGLGDFLKSAADIPDFSWNLDGDNLTLTGTAPSADVKAAVEAAAKLAWPNAQIDNQIQVVAGTTPAPSAPGGCATLQADITDLLKTPVNFETDGFTVAPSSRAGLTQIADKVKACPDARLSVDGYTDSSGNDAINIPLSGNRAKSVADFLVSQGVAANAVTSEGHGSANPIGPNDTPAGKAQNRRVEITVS